MIEYDKTWTCEIIMWSEGKGSGFVILTDILLSIFEILYLVLSLQVFMRFM